MFLLTGTSLEAVKSLSFLYYQDNSLQEWSFKRAITVRTYSTYHPIPVPFNLLSVPLMVLWNLCWRDTPASLKGGRVSCGLAN